MKVLKFNAKKLLQHRMDLKLTREELSNYLEVSQASIYKWEIGINQPKLKFVEEITKIFNISINELFTEEEKQTDIEKILSQKREVKKDNLLENKLLIEKVKNQKQKMKHPYYDHKLKIFMDNLEREVLLLDHQQLNSSEIIISVLKIIKDNRI